MSNVGYATVSIIPSAKGFQSALSREIGPGLGAAAGAAGAKSGKAAGGKFRGAFMAPLAALGGPMAAALGGAAIIGGLKGAIDAASDLGEVGTALNQVFGKDGVAAVNAFGDAGAKSLGMSKLEALRAAQSFGVYGKAAGLSGKENAKFSTSLAALGTDLSSFYNTSPEEAIEAIGSGLRGEAEPLRKYGILLDDATLKQEALKQGLIKTTKSALTPQQKVLAAQAVIMKQSKVAQGDFARTSGGLANQQRILAAQMEDSKAKMGAVFLPLATGAVSALNNYLFPAMGKIGGVVKDFFGKLSPIKDVVVGLFDLFAKGDLTGSLTKALGVEEDSPIIDTLFTIRETVLDVVGRVGPAIKGLFDLLFKGDFTGGLGKALGVDEDSEIIGTLFSIRDTFLASFGAIRDFIVGQVLPRFMGIVGAIRGFVTVALPIVQQFALGLWAKLQPLIPQIQAIFGTVGGIITGAMDLIRATIERVTAVISWVWTNWGQGILNFIGTVWAGVLGVIGPALNTIKAIIATVTAIIRGDWSGAWNGIKAVFAGVWDTIKGIISAAMGILGQIIGAALGAIRALWSGAWNGIKSFLAGAWAGIKSAVSSGIGGVVSFFTELPGKILGAIKGLPGQLLSFGADTIQGFINGLISKAGDIVAAVRDKVIGVLPDFVKDFLGIHSPSRVFAELGKWTGEGFIVGITGTRKALLAKTGRLIGALVAASKKGLAAYARTVEAQLGAHAKRRDAIVTQLAAAQSKLKKLQDDAAAYAKTARDKVLETGTVVGKSSFSSIVSGLQRSVAKAKEFAAAIADLRKKGLNTTSLAEIIEAGPAEGLAAARSLLQQGGAAGIQQVNSLVSQLSQSASSVGKNAADAMYGAGINAAKGLVKGLQDQKSAIEKTMSDIAKAMVATIKRALKIKSPSRVFMKLGAFTGEGMARGITSSAGKVTKAADALAYIPEARLGGGTAAAAAGPLVGSLALQSSGNYRDDLEEALFQLRKIRRGGAPYVRP